MHVDAYEAFSRLAEKIADAFYQFHRDMKGVTKTVEYEAAQEAEAERRREESIGRNL
jgi:hypothetical protein